MKNVKAFGTFGTLLMCAASPIGLGSAMAAEANAPEEAEETTQTKVQPGADIVVTGSRLLTNGNESPTPLTVVPIDTLQTTTPSTIPDGLVKLPVFGGGRGQGTINNAFSNNTGNFLALRNFGVVRTLILLDGRRVPPSSGDGTVDVNTLPQMLMQRVDVVTGGASAIYGTDAVTGVVNFVLDKKFEGVKAIAQRGISTYGDNPSWRAGIAAGTSLFGGRGHVEFSYEHYDSAGLDNKSDRRYGDTVYTVQGAGTVANPLRLVPNTRISSVSFGGLITSGPLNGMQFATNGVLSPFVNGTASGSPGFQSGGDGGYGINTGLVASLRSDQAFGRFSFDVTDNLSAYAQGSYARSYNENAFYPLAVRNVTISSTNAFLSQGIQNALAGTPTFTFGRFFDLDNQTAVRSRTTGYNITAGLTGKIFSDFRYDLYYTRGETTARVQSINNINSARLAAALDAVREPGTNNIVCRVTLTNPGLYPGCIPLNLFGPTAESREAVNYVTGTTMFDLTNGMDDFAANISGELFDLWAGPVKVALSGEHRRITLRNDSNAQPTTRPDCTGLLYNCNARTPEWATVVNPNINVAETITEGAIEANIPLLSDLPLVKSLAFNGAFRHAKYSKSGAADTWKIGLDWQVTDDLSFRGTRSRDIRAPTLNDLFAPNNQAQGNYSDLHTGTGGLVIQTTRGNPNLIPEIADTYTFGLVYQPGWLPNFSVSLDYYNIRIDNAILRTSGFTASVQVACEDSNGTSPLCDLYERPLPFSDRTPANRPTMIYAQPINVASTKTHGVDAEMNYAAKFGTDSRLDLRAFVSYQPELLIQTLPGAIPFNAAGAANDGSIGPGVPKWKVNVAAAFKTGPLGFNIMHRWRSSLRPSANPALVYTDPRVPAVGFTDFTFTADFKAARAKGQFFISVENIFNKASPVYTLQANPGYAYPVFSGDDIVGRYFTAGVRMKL